MTFGINVNHVSQGLLSGAYPGLVIDTKKPAVPIAYNIIDDVTLVNFLNVILLPNPKVFVGTIKFSITPNNSATSFQLIDPAGNYSFYYTDSLAINGASEKFFTMPIIFSKITSTLNAKYSLCIFGYMYEYHF